MYKKLFLLAIFIVRLQVANAQEFNTVLVQITEVSPINFNKKSGHAMECEIQMHLTNGTKYHLNRAEFEFKGTKVYIPSIVANKTENFSQRFDLEENAQCWQITNANNKVGYCDMRGVNAEGDCQNFIRIVSTISPERVRYLRESEERNIANAQAIKERDEREIKEALEGLKGISNAK